MKYRERTQYKDWWIEYNPKPIPPRDYDWDFWHDDFDGAVDSGDIRGGAGSDPADCRRQIRNIEAELNA